MFVFWVVHVFSKDCWKDKKWEKCVCVGDPSGDFYYHRGIQCVFYCELAMYVYYGGNYDIAPGRDRCGHSC